MNIEVVHFEDEKYISRRPKVEDFISEYTSFLKENGNRKNPYRDPDNCGTCSALYDMSEKLWGEKLPETWGTDQLGFSASTNRKTIYSTYLEKSDDEDKFEFVAECIYDTRTIGGCFICPKVKRGNRSVSEYNTVRGGHKISERKKYFLEDRADVALLEIQNFFKKYNENKNYDEFITEYRNDKRWMLFNYTSNYPSNEEEYKIMFEWLASFGSFECYCKWFYFYNVFVVCEDNVIRIIDIVNSDLQNDKFVYLTQPVTSSIYDLSADAIRKMLDNIRCLVNKRSNEIHSNNQLGTSL